MTQSFATKAAFRFGYGFATGERDLAGIEQILQQVQGPDLGAATYAGLSLEDRLAEMQTFRELRNIMKSGDTSVKTEYRAAIKKRNWMRGDDMRHLFQRAMMNNQGFRERLAFFWSDHFTIIPKGLNANALWGNYLEQAIRPHITGSFGDLLVSAVTHPSMLLYLDQVGSTGPNSKVGKRKKLGLNENLAREVLELHTMGVDGAYKQSDVRQFAELLTGLDFNRNGPHFNKNKAEPGAETVLGKTYGGDPAKQADIELFLRDVARHPDTAHNVARKLATHFVSDTPDEQLVAHVAQTFSQTDGDLLRVYWALLEHPSSWGDLGQKAKQPFDFMVSSYRALGVSSEAFIKPPNGQIAKQLSQPIQFMGQPLRTAPGPNGWPEEAEAWITPQGLAGRLQWALTSAIRWGEDTDPRQFIQTSLRELAGQTLQFAVSGAERREEGLTLVLASPEFNRR
ncbi:DUF1800 domain-containing protein [Roseobacter sp. N2S]|uniref:DUF1800 domain-containing protein n=1 Tax=Roseobacter sp. N2S TaxID=2663844 RepID=UPI002859D98F|nr:DUF1800 domain-containing protein [Roseobacter sp. N2S]MDR6264779.1 uncharacterized protein (DUF1800 family) [Roseobacter sp. N2S]